MHQAQSQKHNPKHKSQDNHRTTYCTLSCSCIVVGVVLVGLCLIHAAVQYVAQASTAKTCQTICRYLLPPTQVHVASTDLVQNEISSNICSDMSLRLKLAQPA